MINTWSRAKSRLHNYVKRPPGVIIGFIILAFIALFFLAFLRSGKDESTAAAYKDIATYIFVLYIIITPLITISFFRDREKSDPLNTPPVIVSGQFLPEEFISAFLYLMIILGASLFYSLVWKFLYSSVLPTSVVFTTYTGLILAIIFFISISIFCYYLLKDDTAAYLLSLLITLILEGLPSSIGGITENLLSGYLSPSSHFVNSFAVGQVKLVDVSYYLELHSLALTTALRLSGVSSVDSQMVGSQAVVPVLTKY